MRRALPLRTRLAALAALSVAVAVAAMAFAAYFFFDRELARQLDVGLARESNRILLQLKQGDWYRPDERSCQWLAAPACAQLVTAAPGGPALFPVAPEARGVAAGTRAEFTGDVVAGGLALRVRTVPVRPGQALQVAVRSDQVAQSLDRIRRVLLLAGAGGVVLACGCGYLVARAGLRPLARITGATRHIAETRDPGHRITVRGRDEPAELARHFNTMLAALEESLTAQRRLVADASHELRTPLTALRSDIDLLTLGTPLTDDRRRQVLRRIGDQFEELTRLVDDLIELARGDEPRPDPEAVPLEAVVGERVELARRHWPGVTFTARLEPALVTGSAERLARAVGNLLDNAAKFSPAGGTVAVELTGRRLTVRDEGPGVAEADRARVFDRFYRAPAMRGVPGSGLGLAIVAQVARAHGARAEVGSAPGGGAEFVVRFPPG
ncbi:HAMP domain-containing sensor histidine kinase [Amycolatopsis sp. PS_44_ISF1]|uniref:HAMP domain-containing sensor histidine kinase n=1 Tax=Amycolatopsis sp. PS_44_ISF1 TaxID=2974917 RepID=UPI0028E06539|nr:HAMP domain-containing sensor histidine kinase [Amycolatopsis sp. PS_44_ISF1]MDT8913234.1 HAMP domain-containing histidine kinase [Amycolatopsis sp. PS_44_ISF1]